MEVPECPHPVTKMGRDKGPVNGYGGATPPTATALSDGGGGGGLLSLLAGSHGRARSLSSSCDVRVIRQAAQALLTTMLFEVRHFRGI